MRREEEEDGGGRVKGAVVVREEEGVWGGVLSVRERRRLRSRTSDADRRSAVAVSYA